MASEKIWLSSPHMGNNEQKFVSEAFDTNWIAPLGPHVNNFEADLQSYNKIDHAAALSSGTAALHLALILNDVEPGDLVFVQSFTFSATVNPIIYQGATPVFIDSEKDSWNMCPIHLENAISSALKGEIHPRPVGTPASGEQPQTTIGKPKCIMPVHLYGMPANMEAIMAIAKKYNLPVIEDAAESLGSTYQGVATGTLGDMGVYSFNGNKIITTSGGGALVSNDKGQIEKARFLATQARDAAPHYQHSHIGYNYRMSNVLAGIGRGQMQVLDERVAQRRANYFKYKEYFEAKNKEGYNVKLQNEPKGSFSNRWLTAIEMNPNENKGVSTLNIMDAFAQDNIESRPLWKPMHLQPIFERYPFVGDGTCQRLFETGLCLPSGSSLSDKDFERIVAVLDSCFQ